MGGVSSRLRGNDVMVCGNDVMGCGNDVVMGRGDDVMVCGNDVMVDRRRGSGTMEDGYGERDGIE